MPAPAQTLLVVMRAPVRTEQPLLFRLTLGEERVNLHFVESASSGHGVLIREDAACRTQPALVAQQPQVASEREPSTVHVRREGNANEGDAPEEGRDVFGWGGVLDVQRCVIRQRTVVSFSAPPDKLAMPVVVLETGVADEDSGAPASHGLASRSRGGVGIERRLEGLHADAPVGREKGFVIVRAVFEVGVDQPLHGRNDVVCRKARAGAFA